MNRIARVALYVGIGILSATLAVAQDEITIDDARIAEILGDGVTLHPISAATSTAKGTLTRGELVSILSINRITPQEIWLLVESDTLGRGWIPVSDNIRLRTGRGSTATTIPVVVAQPAAPSPAAETPAPAPAAPAPAAPPAAMPVVPGTGFERPALVPNDFGGQFSGGIAIGGGGIIGIPMRLYPHPQVAFEFGPYLRPFLILGGPTGINGMAAGGFVFYFSKYVNARGKCRTNGMFLKGGYSWGFVSDYFAAIGWSYEGFRVANRSFGAELGLGYMGYNRKQLESKFSPDEEVVGPLPVLIYWKFSWTWFAGHWSERRPTQPASRPSGTRPTPDEGEF